MTEADWTLQGSYVKGDSNTKEKILELLLAGSKTAAEVSKVLKIQKSAARVHLESLQAEGHVKSRFKIERLGRPKKVYMLTDYGRELFPRKYDTILNLLLKKIMEKDGGREEAKKLVESIADDIAAGIRSKIDYSQGPDGTKAGLKDAVKILNAAANELGFVSSVSKQEPKNGEEQVSSSNETIFSIESRNCILHRVALENQDIICHGLHDRIIKKSLVGNKAKVKVELKECMALGHECCRHTIASGKGNTSD